jgi:putative photosynthetic complex assembly protein 2
MFEVVIPVVFAVFVWWFSTGVVLLLNGLPRTSFRWSVLISSILALTALVGLAHSSQDPSVLGAYTAFTCALLVWGWHELTFLTGWLTGPRRRAGDPDCTGWVRLRQAVAAILWHDLAILFAGLLIVFITWDAPNQTGTWTFLVLWVMRASAKFNLFLGVRNLSEDFLPAHLAYLESYFRRQAMNPLLPFSVVGSCVLLAVFLVGAFEAGVVPGYRVGLILAATITLMAIVEHLLLVLPLPSTALWRWALRRPRSGPELIAAKLESTDEDLLHAR